MRDMVSRLLLQVDEAWLDHAQRIRNDTSISSADIQLEETLFAVGEWLDGAERRSPCAHSVAAVVQTLIVSTLASCPSSS
jgi:hypothetical protein